MKGRWLGITFSEYDEYMFGEPEYDLTQSRSLLHDYDDHLAWLDDLKQWQRDTPTQARVF